MNTMFSLSLSASLLVVMLYPVFQIMVNRCRSFRFNRLLMLSGIAIIILAPIVLTYIPISDAMTTNSSIQTNIIQLLEVNVLDAAQPKVETSRLEFIPLILGLYWIGVFGLVVRLFISYTHLWRIISKSEKQRIEGYVLCRHESKGIAPFSWGQFIVLPAEENEQSILIHEKAHTLSRHWIDVSIADFFCIFMWYNPFAWMLKILSNSITNMRPMLK